MLIGQWLGNSTDDQGNPVVEYADFFDDGSFEFCFMHVAADGQVLEQTIELGDWGLVGNIHFTVTKNDVVDEKMYAADLTHPDNYHAYEVTKLTAERFEYFHIVSKETFILKRVIDNIGYC